VISQQWAVAIYKQPAGLNEALKKGKLNGNFKTVSKVKLSVKLIEIFASLH